PAGHGDRFANRALTSHAGTGTAVRATPEFLWRPGALARRHRTLRRACLFGLPTRKRDRHSDGARRANRQRAAAGAWARIETGFAGTGGGRSRWLRLETSAGQPIFRD